MNNSSYLKYIQEVNRVYRPLTEHEERVCFEQLRKGNRKAYHVICNSMLKFVIKVAQKYKNRGVELEDLIQEGNIALDISIKKFDPSENCRFMTYAVGWIKSAMLDKIAEMSYFTHITGTENQLKIKISKASNRLEQRLCRKPTIEEISIESKLSVKKLTKMGVLDTCGSLDSKLFTDEESSLLDVVPSHDIEEPYELKDLKEKINDFIKTSPLTDDNKKLVKLHNGFDVGRKIPFEEMASIFKVSKQLLSVRYEKSINTLKELNYIKKLGNKPHLTPDFSTT
jgi:RNA polymerase sigma factor (sigma-70 family)